jgi:hypothetical protein
VIGTTGCSRKQTALLAALDSPCKNGSAIRSRAGIAGTTTVAGSNRVFPISKGLQMQLFCDDTRARAVI